MEKRSRPRIPKRLTCEIALHGQRYPGIVHDLSERGLFVQTLANPTPNSVVEILFAGVGDRPDIRLEAGVARRRIAPPRLQAAVPSGVGLEILPPRTEYERWIARPSAGPRLGDSISIAPAYVSAEDPSAPSSGPIRTFRFRMRRRDRPESRLLTIRCETEAGARARALARAGAGWKIANMERL